MKAHTTTQDSYLIAEVPGDDTPRTITQPDVSLIDLHPGMACRTANGHAVRIMQILHAELQPAAEVHLLRNPRVSGPMWLDELTPIPVKVLEGDAVLLHIGDLGFPIQARVIEVSGDYALFFSSKWNEALWGHTAHIMSISPRRNPGAK